jgi:hypothetical protein
MKAVLTLSSTLIFVLCIFAYFNKKTIQERQEMREFHLIIKETYNL